MWTIITGFLIVAVGTMVVIHSNNAYRKNLAYYYEEKLADKDKIIKGMQKDIDYLCTLNGLPLMGNFEDYDFPEEERFDQMLDEILLQTNIKKEL